MQWREQTREHLSAVLPEAVVVVPIGATEQHGPYLPTWTDALLVEAVATAAVERAQPAASRDLVVTPTIPVGASDHHLPYGGTLSLSTETLLSLLLDLARSISACGGKRIVIVNGHGGNQGTCSAAAAAAANRYDVSVAYVSYWTLASVEDGPPWPGHAGEFEASLVRAVRPDLVGEIPARETIPSAVDVASLEVHSRRNWSDIQGYSDDPSRSSADRGAEWLDALVQGLSDRLVEFARQL